ncbi:hypothetical protein ACIBSR_37985 [Streptomyces sp. NPDC049936]|uniref:hypothetical protein n=1 Tax=Streptomyces sp. NPDC049936 TaxID=3365599 RepID=UPI00379839ED
MTLVERPTALVDGMSAVHWPHEMLDYSWWDAVPLAPLPAAQQARLRRLHRATFASAVGCTGASFKVVLYASVPPGSDPSSQWHAAEVYAQLQGWRIVNRFADHRPAGQPFTRAQWHQALKALRGGFAQGVVTTDAHAVPLVNNAYEHTLRWLLDHFSFVVYTRPEPVALSPRADLPFEGFEHAPYRGC